MRSIYTISILLYGSIMHLAALFSPKAKLWCQGQKNLLSKIAQKVEPGYIVWIHAASVGEFEQARPLIERVRKEYPTKKILLTFFSPSGYELRKNYDLVDYVFYLPLDTKRNAQKFIDIVKPEMVFFIKYEYWFNYLNELYKRVIPIYIVSAILRPSQHFFKWYGGWFRKHLRMIEHFFVQDITTTNLLGGLDIVRISISGDTRFDRVKELTESPKQFGNIEEYVKDEKVLLAGSTWEKDEKVLLHFIQNETKRFKLIIAPHEVNKDHIDQIVSRFANYNPILYSDYENKDLPKDHSILIIDSVGKLMHLYRYATVAYIGGGFGAGIHNTLEAATYEKPVIFGPNYKKFNEAKELIKIGGGFSIRTNEEFQNIASKLLFDDKSYQKAAKECGDYVNENIGATDKIFEEAFDVK